ncbi:hypothetical protein DFH09DRAFT_177230 [Mycena vulgaris]|nr:hypothetical protein DFH09DRAFT_177230 [Mycena vulgaris]
MLTPFPILAWQLSFGAAPHGPFGVLDVCARLHSICHCVRQLHWVPYFLPWLPIVPSRQRHLPFSFLSDPKAHIRVVDADHTAAIISPPLTPARNTTRLLIHPRRHTGVTLSSIPAQESRFRGMHDAKPHSRRGGNAPTTFAVDSLAPCPTCLPSPLRSLLSGAL